MKREMGPNVLWLTEALSEKMELRPGMRLLDLGCGRAMSSVFLAREFGVKVCAADLWIKPAENWQTICEAGLEDEIFPVHTEAHQLPFAEGYFDAIVSVDAYHYFGTNDLYAGYIAQFLGHGGQLGIVVPGLREELSREIPAALKPHWDWEFGSFHSPAWWKRHWEKTGQLQVQNADLLPGGHEFWERWDELCLALGKSDGTEMRLLQADEDELLGFSRVIARKI